MPCLSHKSIAQPNDFNSAGLSGVLQNIVRSEALNKQILMFLVKESDLTEYVSSSTENVEMLILKIAELQLQWLFLLLINLQIIYLH